MKVRMMLIGAVALSVVQFAGTVQAGGQSPKFKEAVEVSAPISVNFILR